MAQFYKVLKADPLGDPWTPNFEGAKETQTYWCQLEGVDKDVSIGRQTPKQVVAGEQVYGELVYAKSQKGTEYWKFKSAKVPDGVERPASTPAQAAAQAAVGSDTMPAWFTPVYNMIEYIYKEMKKMDTSEPEPKKEEKPVEVEPVSEEDQAVIDGIFGTGDEPEPPEPKEK